MMFLKQKKNGNIDKVFDKVGKSFSNVQQKINIVEKKLN
jgi:hypothetical protein